MSTINKFILVDYDSINNMLNEFIISSEFPDAEIIAFTLPLKGLEYILSFYGNMNAKKTILFLDINMPKMSGWDFMVQIEKADAVIKENLIIYILSSSINLADINKAKENPNIVGYIEKPLTTEFIQSLKV
ncbi:response regulator [Emticicia sp. SJ17W-69]|uniref:response regulator n=1 Tax=Emticicia sp. SJ17W-69 TaxID=3421657 RepID=UPI003EBDED16